MKKCLLCVLLTMILTMSIAFAEEPVQYAYFNVSVSTTNAYTAQIRYSYNTSVFEYVDVSTDIGGGTDGTIRLKGSPLIPSGVVAVVKLKVKEGAPSGTYSLTITGVSSATDDIPPVLADLTASSSSVTIEAAAHDHVWVLDEDQSQEASCTVDGKKVYVCTCGETKVEPITAEGHKWGEGVKNPDATCTDPGKLVYTCSVCQETKEDPIAAKGHTEEVVKGKASTCTETGLSDGKKCAVCGKVLEEQKELPLADHTEEVVKGKEPTCTETGLTEGKKCAVCDKVLEEQKELPLADHTEEVVKGKEPTCTETGLSDGKKCAVCEKVLEEQKVIDKLGHKEEILKAVDPTCTETGLTEGKKCSRCGEILLAQQVVDALDHKWDAGKVTTEPACEEEGVRTFTCQNDNAHTKTEPEPAVGHKFEDDADVIPPTCTEPGKTTATCTVCHKVFEGEVTEPTGHKWNAGVVTTKPTCEKEGVKTFTCENDGSHTYTEPVDALQHKWDAGVVTTEPTCEQEGVKTFTCENDSAHTYTEPVAKKPHTWGDWVEIKPVTDDEDGERQHTCKDCGTVETEVISRHFWYIMTVCSEGIRFRDLDNPITDLWYMFTPIDLSVEGVQTLDLIAGNIHKVGTVTVEVKDGMLTVDYVLVDPINLYVTEEFMTFLPTLTGMTELDLESMTNYTFGEPINIAETFGDDTKVLLLIRNRMSYLDGNDAVDFFDFDGAEYFQYAEKLKQLMD